MKAAGKQVAMPFVDTLDMVGDREPLGHHQVTVAIAATGTPIQMVGQRPHPIFDVATVLLPG